MTDIDTLREQHTQVFEGGPVAISMMADFLFQRGRTAEAMALSRYVRTAFPQNMEAESLLRKQFNAIPSFHHSLLRDQRRNDIYDRAIRRAVRPGAHVLEIGTGSGILAMMAARAGAAKVITCERDPILAEAAREVIRRNGFADRITVLTKDARDLDLDADLGEPADVFVAEIYSNNIVGQSCLELLAATLPRLLKPNARIVPRLGAVNVALAHCDHPAIRQPYGRVSGFDLASFTEVNKANCLIPAETPISLRGAPGTLFAFSFSGRHYPSEHGKVQVTADGRPCNGVVQWIRLEMDDIEDYENIPGRNQPSCWDLRFYPFPTTVQPAAGEIVSICGSHNKNSLRVWLEMNRQGHGPGTDPASFQSI